MKKWGQGLICPQPSHFRAWMARAGHRHPKARMHILCTGAASCKSWNSGVLVMKLVFQEQLELPHRLCMALQKVKPIGWCWVPQRNDVHTQTQHICDLVSVWLSTCALVLMSGKANPRQSSQRLPKLSVSLLVYAGVLFYCHMMAATLPGRS